MKGRYKGYVGSRWAGNTYFDHLNPSRVSWCCLCGGLLAGRFSGGGFLGRHVC